MRDCHIGPVGGNTKPRGEPIEVGHGEGAAGPQTIEERPAANDDRRDARQRFTTPADDFGIVRIGDRSQCVLVCVVHTPLCVVYDASVNVEFAARDAGSGGA